MRECSCPVPQPSTNPRKLTDCEKCGFHVPPEWLRIDRQVTEFFDRLAESQFRGRDEHGYLLTTPEWDAFREHCQLRELAGREKFGLDYLARDNPVEATEEATDGALYMMLHGLRCAREGRDDQADSLLSAAYHFYRAHYYCRLILSKDRGNTGPAWDDN